MLKDNIRTRDKLKHHGQVVCAVGFQSSEGYRGCGEADELWGCYSKTMTIFSYKSLGSLPVTVKPTETQIPRIYFTVSCELLRPWIGSL
ncbi:hypothetical protein ACFX2C_009294 [Malus domestica]